MIRLITEVLPSYYFPSAIIIITDCPHRHVRPKTWRAIPGEVFNCPMCDDEKNPADVQSESR